MINSAVPEWEGLGAHFVGLCTADGEGGSGEVSLEVVNVMWLYLQWGLMNRTVFFECSLIDNFMWNEQNEID